MRISAVNLPKKSISVLCGNYISVGFAFKLSVLYDLKQNQGGDFLYCNVLTL